MRKINKNIILLSIILAAVFVNNSDISANVVKRGGVGIKQESMQGTKTAIENSLKNNDYVLFTNTLKSLNIKETVSTDQFSVLVNAYKLFKSNKANEAVKLLKDNKVNPALIKFVNNRPDLTDAQKETLKKASDLIKQGKIDEAKLLISNAGISSMPRGIDNKINKLEEKINKQDFKKALDQARELKKQGKIDEAKKILKDAGILNQNQNKINIASTTNTKTNKVGFFQSIKNLFIK